MRFDDVQAVFTDLDGTMTTAGKLLPSTYAAMAQLTAAGVPVVIVTGRPAGWGEAIARIWPVTAVITENGCVSITKDARGHWKRRYSVPAVDLPALRQRMHEDADAIAREVPGARLSADSTFTEVNLAVDWNEDVRLKESAAKRIEALLRERGYSAVRSSVHVNFWPKGTDKLIACKRIVKDVLGGSVQALTPYIYVGDALNDEPMFGGFPRAVGVAGIAAVWGELEARPRFVTVRDGGVGFEEVARAILAG